MSGLETLDVGQANELKFAFHRNGWTDKDIKGICEGDILADIRRVIHGYAEIQEIKHVIDCDADSFVPEGWTVEEHQKGGLFRWDSAQVRFYLSDAQKGEGTIEGPELRAELVGKPVLNANVPDYLFTHQHLLFDPRSDLREWRGKIILFLGTVYRDQDGDLMVRSQYLQEAEGEGSRWEFGYWHLTSRHGYNCQIYVALRADVPDETV